MWKIEEDYKENYKKKKNIKEKIYIKTKEQENKSEASSVKEIRYKKAFRKIFFC